MHRTDLNNTNSGRGRLPAGPVIMVWLVTFAFWSGWILFTQDWFVIHEENSFMGNGYNRVKRHIILSIRIL